MSGAGLPGHTGPVRGMMNDSIEEVVAQWMMERTGFRPGDVDQRERARHPSSWYRAHQAAGEAVNAIAAFEHINA